MDGFWRYVFELDAILIEVDGASGADACAILEVGGVVTVVTGVEVGQVGAGLEWFVLGLSLGLGIGI